jgi:hypothetical protein
VAELDDAVNRLASSKLVQQVATYLGQWSGMSDWAGKTRRRWNCVQGGRFLSHNQSQGPWDRSAGM